MSNITTSSHNLDAQQVGILGYSILVSLFVTDNIEVANPLRDNGIDLIAYTVKKTSTDKFKAIPIQLKTFTNRGFSLNEKKYKNMLMAYVWFATIPSKSEVYVMSFDDAVKIAKSEFYDKNKYVFNGKPSKQFLLDIQPYQCTPGYLKKLINTYD